jgi:hypothetical protein
MRPTSLLATGFCALLAFPLVNRSQDKPISTRPVEDAAIARIQKLLDEIQVETKGLQEKMPLTESLLALEALLPKDARITLRIDKEGFGADLSDLAQSKVRLLFSVKPGKASFRSALHYILKQLPKNIEVDYGIRDGDIVLTRPQQATHRAVYDVRDVVRHMPVLRTEWRGFQAGVFDDVPSGDEVAALVRSVANSIQPRPWETIDLVNGSRLVFNASPARHAELRDVLFAMRRLADLHVVMNARLYEIDRIFYSKEVAPLFAKPKDGKKSPTIVSIEKDLFKRIAAETLLLESEEVRIRPHQPTTFLAKQSDFRYRTSLPLRFDEIDLPGPKGEKAQQTVVGTGLAGVTFKVAAQVSPDRRYLRLRVTQAVAQLVAVDKTKKLDPATGKESEVESPNESRSSVTGTVQIPDGNPILMPVEYRPPGKGKEDKVWLLLARPFIWIEEEVQERRQGGKEFSQKTVWESDIEEETPTQPEKRLPLDDDTKEILQAVITDVLTNKEHRHERASYGTEKDKTVTLVDSNQLGWPKDFLPNTHGYKLVTAKFDPFANGRRVLGIRLDKFDLKEKKSDLFEGPIQICLCNSGGTANGAVIGGCLAWYSAKREGKKWIVEFESSLDP